MRFHIVNPVQFAGIGVEAVHEAGEVANEQKPVPRIDRHGRNTPLNSLIRPDRTAVCDISLLGGVDANEVADALAMLRILATRDIHSVVVLYWGGVYFIWPLSSWVFDLLAVLVLLVLRRVGVVPPDLTEEV